LLDAPRFREGVALVTVDLNRTTRLRSENTTWRTDQEAFVMSGPAVHHIAVEEPTSGRDKLTYPAPAHKSYFLPSPPSSSRSSRDEFAEDLLDVLALGIGDYFEKTGAFKTIGVALSGGRDSLLCLMLARRFIDQKWAKEDKAARDARARTILRGFFMPTRYSSEETKNAAEKTAEELCATFAVVSVDDAFQRELGEIEKMLVPPETVTPVARQNMQARVRAARMWTWANSSGGLFLQTSNMSEKAVGYATIGGDMEGALSVIANVPKTVVNFLLDYLLETTGSEAIRLTLKKPASAELADNQEDERELMPFPVLDACFALYAGEKMSPDEVEEALGATFPEHDRAQIAAWTRKFARLFTMSIYKWVQTPLSLHVGNLDLDRERALQLPVVQKTEWQ
jgi:NAD+ synthase (glutamine-hydrolysing)